MKKVYILLLISIGLISLISFNAASPEPPSPPSDVDQGSFEHDPPVVKNLWVQKLESELPNGSTMIMRIEYESDDRLAEEVEIFYGDEITDKVVFHDDGEAPDLVAGDLIYSAYLIEDIDQFVTRIEQMESNLDNQESFLFFTGHVGEVINEKPQFDATVFDLHEEVPLNGQLLVGLNCNQDFLKQNTLFITDLAVVEDPVRTYNVVTGGGNPNGCWTFGNLIKNIANTSYYTSNSVKDFLRFWLRHWTYSLNVNGHTVAARTDIIETLIAPWLTKCYPNIGTITILNWETKWNQSSITEADLLMNAPFKLTAIVNRLDLRGNAAYTSAVSAAGETRFIFTLIDPFDGPIPSNQPPHNTYKIPKQNDQPFNGPLGNDPSIDWEGMNIIFEYRNVQTTRCDMKAFAEAWLNLSSYEDRGDSYFLEELEDITHTVIDANSMPGAPNRSAISSIRTNEKLFQNSTPTNQNPSQLDVDNTWRGVDWELRQFVVDPVSHYLTQAPVTNTPTPDANYASFDPNYNWAIGNYASTEYAAMASWISNNKFKIAKGSHSIPVNYLAPVARIQGEFLHYFETGWSSTPPSNVREIRRQYSLNTCQGCHSGETKTVFTHVRPLPYQTGANYWRDAIANGPPDYTTGYIDIGDGNNITKTTNPAINPYVNNLWETVTPTVNVYNYPKPENERYWQNVSAFLTGRSYGGVVGSGTYDDDNPNDPNDNRLTGLYFVNDPTNGQYGTTIDKMKQKGYNDLEMRKQSLCLLINSTCFDGPGVRIFAVVMHKPFPPGAH